MGSNATGMPEEQVTSPIWHLLDRSYYGYAHLAILCKNQIFMVEGRPDYFSGALDQKERFLLLLEAAQEGGKDGFKEEDLWNWAIAPLLPILEALPPAPEIETFHDFLFAKSTKYNLCAGPSGPIVTLVERPNPFFFRYSALLSDKDCESFKTFSPSEVKISKGWISSSSPWAIPEKVVLPDGTISSLRLLRNECQNPKDELEAFRKINAAVRGDALIQRTYGLLKTDDERHYASLESENGVTLGLLLSHIDCKWDGTDIAAREEDPSLRPKWARQIRQSVETLHAAGIVWGYADPANVKIDRNNDAWTTDCGDGYVESWMPKELAGTKEGDWHAVEKILGFQYLDECISLNRKSLTPLVCPHDPSGESFTMMFFPPSG
ncbi:unnamed protein product [Clonostachys rosea]|uniref:Protein kinase domain-containing protein n=1 Tax=Bionectria ochroleuca TaxID=29856 RepID=A0ABY6UZF3_BIOOC|nr:unnamed protein product [Clonostachys rosea]